VALVLISYYGGVEKIEGPLHDLTGIALFIVAVLLMFACDGLITFFGNLIGRRARAEASAASR
jgi:hypothetical protein